MTEPRPVIAGVGVTHPPALRQDDLWRDFFAGHYAGPQRALARRIFANAGVATRHSVVNPLLEDVSRWSTKARMERYLVEALPLGKEAVTGALDAAGLDPARLGLFAVCSCTGYATPGLDILLARDLGMSPRTQRLFIGHMGCYAALPGLGTVTDFVASRGEPALLLCLELTTLHLQPPTRDPQQIVAHALFSDAAAAVVVVPGDVHSGGYTVREVTAVTDTATADHMTWDVTDQGFRMRLSPQVPDVLAEHIGPLVSDLLGRHGLEVSDVDGWAVHPGGPKILDVVRDGLGLSEERMAPSRQTLTTHGNCSSPTVLLIVDALRRSPAPPRTVVATAFGPGLTLYAALLSAVQPVAGSEV
ncbi:type III polyketide synthase [Planosporangium thailandense]|uniref:Type III polyketide synthase n=1 Tax=Planosporangium thailandense TaxID=765197 RepID=A0ABX0Y6Y2_9ACTN|nr:3-oxoacyl-[acyl-carrier-protein] synthase III C-terminal domain-containing protein [Planosporangium thailandense]NJC73867.1 type III polyketide synthase [Planosporangium thailandense]